MENRLKGPQYNLIFSIDVLKIRRTENIVINANIAMFSFSLPEFSFESKFKDLDY